MHPALLIVGLLILSAVPVDASPAEDRILAPVASDLSAIQDTLELPAATWYNDQDGDKVFDSLEQRFQQMPGLHQPAIVTFVHDADFDATMDAVRDAAPFVDFRYEYRHYGGFAADLNAVEAAAIAAIPEVRQVEWSQPGSPELDTATVTMNVRTVQEELGITGDLDGDPDTFTGEDTIIAILDTGFDGKHVDLQGKFLHFIDWSDAGKEKDPYDAGSHGTHVASIAGGLGVGNPDYKGVAPGASFVGFLISSSDTKGAAIASIDWILEHRNETPVDVLTISFGFGFTQDGTDALELAMDKAWAAGVTNFKSTGNSGPNRGTVTIPGGARGIIGTASMYDAGEGGFRLSSFSSRGPTTDGRVKPDIAAPGSLIMAASAGSTDGYVSFSGTSMASPFAAGVAALIKSVDPSLGPDQIREILIQTAEDWGPAGHDIDYGNGRLDALRAIQAAAQQKALRENLPYEAIAGLDVPGVQIPSHAHGVVSGTDPTATFTIEDADQPLAVTFLANFSAGQTPFVPFLGSQHLYGYVAVVTDPDGIPLAFVEPGAPGTVPSYGVGSNPNNARQQTVSIMPGQTGDHTIRFLNPTGVEEVLYDITAGLPPSPLDAILYNSTQYVGMVEPTVDQPQDDKDTPAPAALLALVALAVLAVLRRR